PDDDDPEVLRHRGGEVVGHSSVPGPGEEHRRAGVLDDRGELAHSAPPAQRHGDRSGLCGAEQELHNLGCRAVEARDTAARAGAVLVGVDARARGATRDHRLSTMPAAAIEANWPSTELASTSRSRSSPERSRTWSTSSASGSKPRPRNIAISASCSAMTST